MWRITPHRLHAGQGVDHLFREIVVPSEIHHDGPFVSLNHLLLVFLFLILQHSQPPLFATTWMSRFYLHEFGELETVPKSKTSNAWVALPSELIPKRELHDARTAS